MDVDFDSLGSYYPINRSEKYPRTLLSDFSRLKTSTLKRYAKAHGLTIRPDSTPSETAVAVARHFESRAKVDEEGAILRFMNAVRKSTGALETAKQNKKAHAREVREAEEQQQQQARSLRLARQRATPTEDAPQAWHAVGHPAAGYIHPSAYGYPAAAQITGRHAVRPDASDAGDSSADDSENVELFCLCQRPSYGEMVACDNPECTVEWFHIACVGLTGVPAQNEQWFCPDCRPTGDSDDELGGGRKGGRFSNTKKRKLMGGAGGGVTSNGKGRKGK